MKTVANASEYYQLKLATVKEIQAIAKHKTFRRPISTPEYDKVMGYNSLHLITDQGEVPITHISQGSLNMIKGMLEREQV